MLNPFPLTASATRLATPHAALAKLGMSMVGLGSVETGSPVRTDGHSVQATATIMAAIASGLAVIDIGAAEPAAQHLIGELVPTRSPLRLVLQTASPALGVDAVEAEVRDALNRLRVPAASALLAPSTDLLSTEGADLWDRMTQLKDEGYFDQIGIRASTDDDAAGLARRFRPDIVQAPVSLVDQRLVASGALAVVAAQGVEVQLRAVLEPGLFAFDHDTTPAMSRMRRLIAETGADPLQASLAFALNRPEASTVIVEIASAAELKAVIAAATAPAPKIDWTRLTTENSVRLERGVAA